MFQTMASRVRCAVAVRRAPPETVGALDVITPRVK